MAPVLLCPECGTKHPLDHVSSDSSFPCSGCGRTLKVPAQAREMSASGRLPVTPPAPAAPAAHPTQVLSAVPPAAAVPPVAAAAVPVAPPLGPPPGIAPARPAREAAAPASTANATSMPPLWMRVLLWIVAVPLAFIVVFGLARAFGFLATNDITDIALADGFHRYWPIVRLLPFVALATALFVTGGVYGIARLRARDHASPGTTGSSPGTPTTRRPAPRQSTRTGA